MNSWIEGSKAALCLLTCLGLGAQLEAATAAAPKAQAPVQKPIQKRAAINWSEFHSVAGKCSVLFPAQPEHISELMQLPEAGAELRYDAYISSLSQDAVLMLLVAQYPEFVDGNYAQLGLESFLNGILNHNPANQLLFADLVLVDGNQALDFFIRTGTVYFKGRAIMVKNSLYLMAMECDMQAYDEVHYTKFIDSFQLTNK